MTGCAEPLPEGMALVQIGSFEFRECPVRFLDPEAEHVVDLWRDDYLADADVTEKAHAPAKLFEAVRYLGSLKGASDGN